MKYVFRVFLHCSDELSSCYKRKNDENVKPSNTVVNSVHFLPPKIIRNKSNQNCNNQFGDTYYCFRHDIAANCMLKIP